MNSETFLSVELDARYGKRTILRDIRFELRQGEVLGLVGESGSGKSTLVLSLLGLLPWRGGSTSGKVMLEGQNLLALPERHLRKLRGNRIALIPQSPMTALNPAISLKSHFRQAWRAHQSGSQAILTARMESLLAEVQLPCDAEFLQRRPSQVSVGQAQRVLIALALLHRPAFIVADEPTSALDPVTQSQILDLLRRLNRRHNASFLYVSHDLLSVLQLSDRIAVLSGGAIVESLPVQLLNEARHPATVALLDTLPAPPDILFRFRDRTVNKQQESRYAY